MKSFLNDFWKAVVRYFLAGVLAVLPLAVTVAIVGWVSSFLASYIGPGTFVGKILSNIGVRIGHNTTTSYVVGWLIVLLVIMSLGMVAQLGAKTFFSRLMERLFGRIPLIGSIYRTSQQVVEMLDSSNKEAIKGMSAIYCRFGSVGGPTILAFLVSPKRFLVSGREFYIVMIPTAPVPFGGAMMLMPVDQVAPADLSVDGMMSIYLSMGVSATDYLAVAGDPENAQEQA